MNLSGRSLRQILDFYKLPVDAVLVVCDDINLPLGRIRLRMSGSSGGQKGLENILQQLGTQDVSRLRVGVDSPPEGLNSADYVLSRFGKRDRETLDPALFLAAEAVETWVKQGIAAAMNQHNGSLAGGGGGEPL